MKRNISREEGQNRESIEKDNLYEVNRYADTAFPVGAYTVTREGIMPWREEDIRIFTGTKSCSLRML